jgi:thioredoxin 1
LVDESGKAHFGLGQTLGSPQLQDSQQTTVLQFFKPKDQFWRTFMSENIVYTSDDGFEADVLSADKPVLVDYWAEWCGPCKMIAPILDEIADEYSDRLKICKLDIDANQGTPPKYGIRGIPTLMLFKNGEVEATKVGALSKSQLQAFLDSNI